MKRPILLLLAALLVSCNISFGQGTSTLHVMDMPNFPDTAYEGQTYSFDIILKNNTNLTIANSIYLFLMVDSTTQVIDSILQPLLIPLDTLGRSITGYGFTQPLYKAGNNIVVVWPVVNSAPAVPTDSFVTEVIFIPLNSIEHPDYQGFVPVYPNPVNDFVFIGSPADEAVEDVRIYSTDGRLVLHHNNMPIRGIPVSALKPGIYLMESRTGERLLRSKFLKL